jgi:serine/threonine protein kinase
VIGTPEYIAPELCRGLKADGRVDIYALGIIMYRLLTGVRPVHRRERQLHGRAEPAPDRPAEPPRELAPTRSRRRSSRSCCAPSRRTPTERYQKVEELIAALRDAQLTLTGASSTGLLTAARAIPRTRKVRAAAGMPLPLLITLGGVLLIGGAAIAWALFGGTPHADDGDLPPVTFAKKTEPATPPPARRPTRRPRTSHARPARPSPATTAPTPPSTPTPTRPPAACPRRCRAPTSGAPSPPSRSRCTASAAACPACRSARASRSRPTARSRAPCPRAARPAPRSAPASSNRSPDPLQEGPEGQHAHRDPQVLAVREDMSLQTASPPRPAR